MRSRSTIVAGLAAAVAIAAVPIAQASPDDRAGEHRSGNDDHLSAARHFEGRITSLNRERHTFRLRRESGVRVRFRVTNRTRFERIVGFSALRRVLAVEVSARRADGGWVARKVERRHADSSDDDCGDDGHDDDD